MSYQYLDNWPRHNGRTEQNSLLSRTAISVITDESNWLSIALVECPPGDALTTNQPVVNYRFSAPVLIFWPMNCGNGLARFPPARLTSFWIVEIIIMCSAVAVSDQNTRFLVIVYQYVDINEVLNWCLFHICVYYNTQNGAGTSNIVKLFSDNL